MRPRPPTTRRRAGPCRDLVASRPGQNSGASKPSTAVTSRRSADAGPGEEIAPETVRIDKAATSSIPQRAAIT